MRSRRDAIRGFRAADRHTVWSGDRSRLQESWRGQSDAGGRTGMTALTAHGSWRTFSTPVVIRLNGPIPAGVAKKICCLVKQRKLFGWATADRQGEQVLNSAALGKHNGRRKDRATSDRLRHKRAALHDDDGCGCRQCGGLDLAHSLVLYGRPRRVRREREAPEGRLEGARRARSSRRANVIRPQGPSPFGCVRLPRAGPTRSPPHWSCLRSVRARAIAAS